MLTTSGFWLFLYSSNIELWLYIVAKKKKKKGNGKRVNFFKDILPENNHKEIEHVNSTTHH